MSNKGTTLRVFESIKENSGGGDSKGVNGLIVRVGELSAGITNNNGVLSLAQFDGVRTLYIAGIAIKELSFGSGLRGSVILVEQVRGKLKFIGISSI